MPIDDRYRELGDRIGIAPELLRDLELTRGIDPERLAEADEALLQRVLRRLDYNDLPRVREAFRLRQQRDESGSVAAGALSKALGQLDSVRARFAFRPKVAGVPTGRSVAPRGLAPLRAGVDAKGAWKSLGPGNVGGRTRAVLVHPNDRKVVFAASVGGGIWRTADSGASWKPVDDFMANLAVTCLAIDPTNANVIYAGTGEGFGNTDALRGAGIFMTDDAIRWRRIESTATDDFHAVNRLAVSADGQVLLAATPHAIWRCADPGRLTWTRVLSQPIGDVDFHPVDPLRAVAGSIHTGEAFVSSDGGLTWTAASHGGVSWGGRVEVTYALANPTIVYASVEREGGQIWRSVDGGLTYSKMRTQRNDGTAAPYLGEQGWYDNTIWAGDPNKPDFVIVGGIDLWKSTNGGDTLVDISSWWRFGSAHADHHAIASDAGYNGTSNRRVYFANDGGVFRTDDVTSVGNNDNRTAGWTELINTYEVTQFYAAAGNAQSGVIIGGTQDNGTIRFDPSKGAQEWTTMMGGDGGWCAADPSDPKFFYGEYVFLNIHRSSNGGVSGEYISGYFWDSARRRWDWKPEPFTIPDARNHDALFIAPFILDPNEPKRLLAGGRSLWRTNNARAPISTTSGPAWERIKPSHGGLISALAVAKGRPDDIWVGHADGQVYVTSNGTSNWPSWSRVGAAGAAPLPSRYCTSLVVDPADANTAFATFGGYSRGNVWKTADRGVTWSDVGSGLPEAPVRALAIHPSRREFVYCGTEVGLFASEDGGATWSPTNEGPTNCSVDDLFWMEKKLIVVTHGRGVFEIDLTNATGSSTGSDTSHHRRPVGR